MSGASKSSAFRVVANAKRRKGDLVLSSYGDTATHRLLIEQIEGVLFQKPHDLSRDLLEIAAAVFIADRQVVRGSVDDVFLKWWSRHFKFVIGVSAPKHWNVVAELLANALGFLTGDSFEFEFVQGEDYARRTKQNEQFKLKFEGPLVKGGCIIPFSGGMDSGLGTAFSIQDGLKPILVSHSNISKLTSRQDKVYEDIATKLGRRPPHISICVNRLNSSGYAPEETQRSRAFLFLSLCAVVARETSTDSIRFFENGPVSFNIPRTMAMVGSTLSRSTHPEFLKRVTSFFCSAGFKATIENPFILKTRKDTVVEAQRRGILELISSTVSCGGTSKQTMDKPHCGACSQCIDRRLSTATWEAEKYDSPDGYRIDPLVDNLVAGQDRLMAEQHGRLIVKVRQWPIEKFFEQIPYAQEAILALDGVSQKTGKAIHSLFIRYATQCIDTIEAVYKSGKYEGGSLTGMMLGKSIPDEDPRIVARYISSILGSSLPRAFHGQEPDKEEHVQAQMENALLTAGVEFEREGPMLCYAGIKTKTDFAVYSGGPLWIEAKFPKDRGRVNSVVKDITSRIEVNRSQGACTLFYVYDPNKAIPNVQEFVAEFANAQYAVVEVIR